MPLRVRKPWWKRLMLWFFIAGVLFVLMIAGSNYWIIKSTKQQLFSASPQLPSCKAALLLGASKMSRAGRINLFFKYRIEAAISLYKSGKVKFIIVSGDNHIKEYDEATDMKDALMAGGVPEKAILLDYAGFRTLDSVVRCKEIFGQDSIVIVSQRFHNQRAIFIANYYGLKAWGFNAQDVPSLYSRNTIVREYFAKFKAVLDLYLLHVQPKFLGSKVKIDID